MCLATGVRAPIKGCHRTYPVIPAEGVAQYIPSFLRRRVSQNAFRHSCARRNPVRPLLDSRFRGNDGDFCGNDGGFSENDDRCATPSQAGIQKKSVSTSKFVFCNTFSMHSHAGAWERGKWCGLKFPSARMSHNPPFSKITFFPYFSVLPTRLLVGEVGKTSKLRF